MLAKKEVAAHTRLTEMTESSVPSYSGYQLVLREQGAGPGDLKPRAHPELCSVKSNRNSFLTFPAGPHRPPPTVRSASPPSVLTHPSPSGQTLENSLLYHTCLPKASFMCIYGKREESQHLRGRRGIGNWEVLFLRIQNTSGWMEKDGC